MKYSIGTKNDVVEAHLLTWKRGYTTLLNGKKQLRKLCAWATPICNLFIYTNVYVCINKYLTGYAPKC